MAQMKNAHVTLYYFNVRGRAEHIRYLFAAGGRVFDDRRLTGDEWNTFKTKTPLGSLPVIEVDGVMIPQSMAIARLAAKMTGLYGSTPVQEGTIDSIVETCNELRETAFSNPWPGKEGFEEKAKEFLEKTVWPTLEKLEGLLGSEDYFVGKKISWADIHFYAAIECLTMDFPTDKMFAKSQSKSLQALFDRVAANKGIAAYISKRPKTEI